MLKADLTHPITDGLGLLYNFYLNLHTKVSVAAMWLHIVFLHLVSGVPNFLPFLWLIFNRYTFFYFFIMLTPSPVTYGIYLLSLNSLILKIFWNILLRIQIHLFANLWTGEFKCLRAKLVYINTLRLILKSILIYLNEIEQCLMW